MKFFGKQFWDEILCKWIEILSSVKVWVLIATFGVSIWVIGWMMLNGGMGSVSPVLNFVASIVTAVVVMREGFKITRANKMDKKEDKPEDFV